jgi:Xaa-Pro aminopeptidase
MLDERKVKERGEKEFRLRTFLQNSGLDAAIIGRQNDFAWLSAGGRNYVLAASDMGAAYAVITRDKKYLVANTMDGERILDEELAGSEYELINLKWYDKTVDETAAGLVKGLKAISDIPITGAILDPYVFFRLHYPLTAYEIERYHNMAVLAEQIIDKIARQIEPGMSEKDVETMFCVEYARHGFLNTVILIGADERIRKYRHPIPTDNKIKNTVLLAPSPRKNGLFIPISRMVYFGNSVPTDLRKKYDTLLHIEAQVIAHCQAGENFVHINEMEKEWYQTSPYPDEWQYHFMGGLTGYVPNDPTQYRNPEAKVLPFQTFNWYLTISGAKVEEILLTTENGNELLSISGIWPSKNIEASGHTYMLPDIMVR